MKYAGGLLLINVLLLATYFLFATDVSSKRILAFTSVGLTVGVVLMVCDRLTKVKIAGVAEMNTTVEQVMADANAVSAMKRRIEAQSATVDLVAEKAAKTVEQLQNVACANAEATITELMAGNFFSGTNLKTRLVLHEQIVNCLKEIGVPEDKIKNANKMWVKGIGIIYHRGVRYHLEGRTEPNKINMNASPELRQASKEFEDLLDFEHWQAPSPDEMESFIEDKGFMNGTVAELIADYRHYLETGTIRRRDVFEKL